MQINMYFQQHKRRVATSAINGCEVPKNLSFHAGHKATGGETATNEAEHCSLPIQEYGPCTDFITIKGSLQHLGERTL